MADLLDAPVVDVRPTLTAHRGELLDFLRALTPDEWHRPSPAGAWTVKDLALHLLDDDLGRLSRDRDGDRTGLLDHVADHPGLGQALADKNQRWVDGTRALSIRVLCGLLEWSGAQLDEYLANVHLRAVGAIVSWAGADPVPVWFDLAREFTERWVHQQQMREAVGRVDDHADRYLSLVLRTFVWALPAQFRAAAPVGTAVEVDVASVGTWHLTCLGPRAWTLDEGPAPAASAAARLTADAAWRWLTGAAVPAGGMRTTGPADLVQTLSGIRSIIA